MTKLQDADDRTHSAYVAGNKSGNFSSHTYTHTHTYTVNMSVRTETFTWPILTFIQMRRRVPVSSDSKCT
jgi:hypothetical protein